MKTSLKNQYAKTNQILIFLVSFVFGYNLYQAIVHPDKSHLILSIILLAITLFMCREYGYKQTKDK
ncbi:hypothetical protein CEY12_14675 [Chryseobacterium sp. T16E-39]|uniref:hypothetical protein n=1 Tax=Chryseobacterium sp. T16E-39 TaxID=2015076 RepID=UPI000B5B0DA4|nr:hypothetical protein [Chryseobacterium sp. T16E-39]ASK31272.1 hypothetical protein CEY12_14675 [Chryseobacterium sp. T16E-39]